jgi:predicted XRE-type DNA-binding protein
MAGLKMNLSNLKNVRQQCSIKQDAIALDMSVTKSSISKLESKNVEDISLKKLTKYIRAIGGTVLVEVTLPDGTTYKIN